MLSHITFSLYNTVFFPFFLKCLNPTALLQVKILVYTSSFYFDGITREELLCVENPRELKSKLFSKNLFNFFFSGNSSSLVSLGLLAVDLLLLRNMQEAAWQDERSLKNKMLQDPEVQALSSLFGPMRETRALQTPSPLQQAVDYVTSTFRAALSLSKAYR